MAISKEELKSQLAEIFGCDETEIVGNVNELCQEADSFGHVNVMWGCIPDSLLNENF